MTAAISTAGRFSRESPPSRENCRPHFGESPAKLRCPRARDAPMRASTLWPRWPALSSSAPIPPENLLRALNRTLPASIRVLEAKTLAATFHARHSTVAKTYEYRIFLERPSRERAMAVVCPPFLAPYVYSYPWPLDFEALQESARGFIGRHDFLSFAATDPDANVRRGESGSSTVEDEEESGQRTSVRTIFGSFWEECAATDGNLLVYRVRGSGFLHHMVRNLVGTMLDVGRGYRRADEIPGVIAARARAAAGPTAPARGLFLHSVEYGGAER